MDIPALKRIALKGLKLQECLNDYNQGEGNIKKQAIQKFINVFGEHLASHFLIKYDNAQSLIWAFDNENFELFIKNF